MEIYGIPTSYTDDNNLWHDFYSYIESLFPFQELNLNLKEINIQIAKNIQLSFFPYNDAVWDNNDHQIYTYKKPFVYFYLLSFEDYDEFKKNSFQKIYNFIAANHKLNEWMVIYYPNITLKNEISYVIFFWGIIILIALEIN